MNQSEISQVLVEWIQNILGKGIPVDFGRLPSKAGACMIRQQPVNPVVRTYLNGSGIYRYTYVVFLSQKTLGISKRSFSAMDELEKVVRAIEDRDAWPSADGFALATHTLDIAPAQHSQAPDGLEIFYIQATLTYFQEGR